MDYDHIRRWIREIEAARMAESDSLDAVAFGQKVLRRRAKKTRIADRLLNEMGIPHNDTDPR